MDAAKLAAVDLENFCTLIPETTSFWGGSSDKDFLKRATAKIDGTSSE